MKFTQHLNTHLTPEWRKQYIQYAELKAELFKIKAAEPLDLSLLPGYYEQEEAEFFRLCQRQLAHINLFFQKQLSESKARYNELHEELQQFKAATPLPGKSKGLGLDLLKPLLKQKTRELPRRDKNSTTTTLRTLKFAFSELYLSLVLLQNFQQLNAVGFRKILKKRDKLLGNNKGLLWRQQYVDKSTFFLSSEVDVLISNVENLVAFDLEGGDRGAAMKRLRVPPLGEPTSALISFRLGLFLGAFTVLLAIVALTLIFRSPPKINIWTAVRLFRPFFLLFLSIFLVGLNMWGWQMAGVNHVLIFEVKSKLIIDPLKLM